MISRKVKKIYEWVADKYTPIKMLASIILVMGLVDNITSLLQHTQGGGIINFENTTIELIIRIVFIFCGLFGILGNGGSARIRATVTTFPFLYLSSLYLIIYLQFHNPILLSFIAMSLIPSLWLILFGDKYE